MAGREILEEVAALLGQVPVGDGAEELCAKLREVARCYSVLTRDSPALTASSRR